MWVYKNLFQGALDALVHLVFALVFRAKKNEVINDIFGRTIKNNNLFPPFYCWAFRLLLHGWCVENFYTIITSRRKMSDKEVLEAGEAELWDIKMFMCAIYSPSWSYLRKSNLKI